MERIAYSVEGKNLKEKTKALAGELEKAVPNFDFSSALSKIWEIINIANKYIEDSKPWTLAKDNKKEELGLVIYGLLESLRVITIAVYAFIPKTAENIWAQLGMETALIGVKFTDIKTWGLIKPGGTIKKTGPIFPRIETK